MMHTLSLKEMPTTSPVKFSRRDSSATKLLKALISQMISMDPDERPPVEEVLEQLTEIAGMYVNYCIIY